MDRCALFVDAGYALADGAMAVHGTRRGDSVSWDHAGLLKLLAGLARDRTGLPVLRCYWYETAAEGRRSAEHDALAEMPGLKLRLVNTRPGRREGVENQMRRDLVTLAKNGAISDAFIASADEHLAEIVAEVQDLGLRVVILHIASDGGWTIPQPLRQECDDIVEISGVHLRPFVDLVRGAEPVTASEQFLSSSYGSRGHADNGSLVGAVTHQGLPAAALPAPGAVYPVPDGTDYRSGAQPYSSAGVAQAGSSAVYAVGNGSAQLGDQSGLALGQNQGPAQSRAGQDGLAQQGAASGGMAQGGVTQAGVLQGGTAQGGASSAGQGSPGGGSASSGSSSLASTGMPHGSASMQEVYPVGTLHNASAPQPGTPQRSYDDDSRSNDSAQRSSAPNSSQLPAQHGFAQQAPGQYAAGQPGSGQHLGAPVAYSVGAGQSGAGQSGAGQSGAGQSGASQNGGGQGNAGQSGASHGGAGQNGSAEQGGGYQSASTGGYQNGAGSGGYPNIGPAGGYQNGVASSGYQNGAGSGGYPNIAQPGGYQGGPGLGEPNQNRSGAASIPSGSYQHAGNANNGPNGGAPDYQSPPGHNGMAAGSYQNAGIQGVGQNGAASGGYQNGSGQNAIPGGYQSGAVAGNAGQGTAGPTNAGQAHAGGQDGSLVNLTHNGAPGAGFQAAPTPSQQVYGAPDTGYFQGQPGTPGVGQGARPGYIQEPVPGGPVGYQPQPQYAMQQSVGQGQVLQAPIAQAPMAQAAMAQAPMAQAPAVRAPQAVAIALPDAVKAAHAEGFSFGESVGRDAPGLWLEAVLARKPRMPSDLEARLLQGSVLPIDSLLHDEVRHSLRRGFWDALESARR